MSYLIFFVWALAGVWIFLPVGGLWQLIRRIVASRGGIRGKHAPLAVAEDDPAAVSETQNATSGRSDRPPDSSWPEEGANEAGGRSRRLARRLAPALSLLVYVGFIAGAIVNVPQAMSWGLDTAHPMATVSSQSMWPALHKGDLVFLEGVDRVESLGVGDIIAFQHSRGVTVHRVVEIKDDMITTKGDGNAVEDVPIRFETVVGRVLEVSGRIVRVPYVGSVASLFGPMVGSRDLTAENPDQQPEATDAAVASKPSAPEGPRSSPGITRMVSVSSDGEQANSTSNTPALSADGRFVAFLSYSTNLVPSDTNGRTDVFVHDRQTGLTERINVDSDGNQANDESDAPAISADGRFVAFVSSASNLVSSDTNGRSDIFVHDRQTGRTERVSVDSAGNEADDGSDAPAISANGRFVAFVSSAANLAPSDTNGRSDIFVHDRQTGRTELISVDSAGNEADDGSDAPAISANGRFVAFVSSAANLVPSDTNGSRDVFVHDRQTEQTERVSVDSAGGQADDASRSPSLSSDGQLVAFASDAQNLVPRDTNRDRDVFVHDRRTGVTERVSVNSAGYGSIQPADGSVISGDGRFVAFHATDGNLVADDTNRRRDVFVRDRQLGTTEQVSVDDSGNQGDDRSVSPAISGDGQVVAFASYSLNFVPVVHAKSHLVYVRERHPGDGYEDGLTSLFP